MSDDLSCEIVNESLIEIAHRLYGDVVMYLKTDNGKKLIDSGYSNAVVAQACVRVMMVAISNLPRDDRERAFDTAMKEGTMILEDIQSDRSYTNPHSFECNDCSCEVNL